MFYLDIKIVKLDQKLIICLAFKSVESEKKEEKFVMSKVFFGEKLSIFFARIFSILLLLLHVLFNMSKHWNIDFRTFINVQQ